MRSTAVVSIVLVFAACSPQPSPGTSSPSPAERVGVSPASDPQAIEIAQAVMQSMGGWESWDRTACVRWRFFGGRLHVWDRRSGDIRIEGIRDRREGQEGDDEFLILMNVDTRRGRVFKNGEELPDGDERNRWLERGHQIWINDSYWMFMPFKLLDPGVTLKYAGESEMQDGRPSDVLELTFSGVGYTPENRYAVHVAKESGLVEQWDFYDEASDTEPRFRMPWSGWRQFGRIMLATDHGQGKDWEIEVYDELPRSVFESPDPVNL